MKSRGFREKLPFYRLENRGWRLGALFSRAHSHFAGALRSPGLTFYHAMSSSKLFILITEIG